jgi:hypothetical protein
MASLLVWVMIVLVTGIVAFLSANWLVKLWRRYEPFAIGYGNYDALRDYGMNERTDNLKRCLLQVQEKCGPSNNDIRHMGSERDCSPVVLSQCMYPLL